MKSFSDFIIDSKILKQNAINIKNSLHTPAKFCAIVKADAYGLGAKAICQNLVGIADYFGVSNINEALEIRGFDKQTPILVLGVVSDDDMDACNDNNISISISNIEKLLEVVKFCKKNKRIIKVHLQINTGLNRYGLNSASQFRKALKIIRLCRNITLEGIYSHFATKGQDVKFIQRQFKLFESYKNMIKTKGVIFHIASSFATLFDDRLHLDMVRNGFLLYGATPNGIGNSFILTIQSQIVSIMDVKPGETVGYDRLYKVTKPTKIAVVPLGYADGIDRRLSNNFSVLINGEFCQIIGNICMDVFMVDVSKINAKVCDKVVLLGNIGNKKITLFDYAEKLGTSPYEVLLKFRYRRMNYIIK